MSNDLGSMLTALHQLAPVASVREASARRQREAPIVESAPMTSSARLALVHAMVGEFFAGGEVVAAQ